MTLVALSAAYGAGGSQVGPALAEKLGVDFLDRAIPLAVARRLGVDIPSAEEHDGRIGGGLLRRALGGFIAQDAGAPVPVGPALTVDEDFRRATEDVLLSQARSGEGVLLGRGAVMVLRERPDVLRVRLHGPVELRAARAARLAGIPLQEAKQALRRVDKAHAAYASRFYGADIDDPALYHLMVDSTAMEIDDCVELLAGAARSLCATGFRDG